MPGRPTQVNGSKASDRSSGGPLHGIRVLDISTVIAAPLAATLLADYGADVVKVELPGTGDPLRGFPPFKDGKALWWKVTNRGKRLITLDLRTKRGREIFLRLLPGFDVLVENFRPGTLDKWGMDSQALWAANPTLTILRASGFGQDGPYATRPGFARLFEAMGGLTYLTGEADAAPMHSAYPLGDAIGGLFGAVGILAALCRRFRGPVERGEEIDLSLTEATLRVLEQFAIEYDQLGVVRNRNGNASQYAAPSHVFKTSDGRYVSLAGSTDRTFARNAAAIGRPDLADDPRFESNRARVQHAAELNRIFDAWIGEHTLDDVVHAFVQADGTLAPVYSADQIFADPQFIARDALPSVADDDFGSVRMQGIVPRFRNDPCTLGRAAGALGRDSHQIYVNELGISEAEYEQLERERII